MNTGRLSVKVAQQIPFNALWEAIGHVCVLLFFYHFLHLCLCFFTVQVAFASFY